MSRIDDLVRELCPDGVEYKALGDIGLLVRGNGLQKKDFTDTGVGCIHYGQIYTHYRTYADQTKSYVAPAAAEKLRKAHPGDLVVATTSENDEDVCKAVAWLGGDSIAVSGDACVIRHSCDPKYVAYVFQTAPFQSQKRQYITGTKVRRVSLGDLARIRVPVPPLDVQRAIVEILDTFSKLEAELEAELEARRKQITYYRDQFLSTSLSDSYPTVLAALGELAQFKYGFTGAARDSGDYRYIRITDIGANGKLSASGAKFIGGSTDVGEYEVRAGDVLMARIGATHGKTMLVEADARAVFASYLIRIRLDGAKVLPSYYWHFAQSRMYWDQVNALVGGGAQPQFNANVLKAVRVPVPALAQQQRAVSTLDHFDALVNDLSIGLPAELAARRKQYEYYRDRLLAFEEKV